MCACVYVCVCVCVCGVVCACVCCACGYDVIVSAVKRRIRAPGAHGHNALAVIA